MIFLELSIFSLMAKKLCIFTARTENETELDISVHIYSQDRK